MFKLKRQGKVVCTLNDKLEIVVCKDALIKQLFKELKKDGLEMRVSKVTKSSITEAIKVVPYNAENKYILKDNLEQLGFEVEIK